MKKNIFKTLTMFLFLCTVAQNYGAAESSAEKQKRLNNELVQAYDKQDYAAAQNALREGADPLTVFHGNSLYLHIVAVGVPDILKSVAKKRAREVHIGLLDRLSKELALMGEMEKKGAAAKLISTDRVYVDRIRQQLKDSQLPEIQEMYKNYVATYASPISAAESSAERQARLVVERVNRLGPVHEFARTHKKSEIANPLSEYVEVGKQEHLDIAYEAALRLKEFDIARALIDEYIELGKKEHLDNAYRLALLHEAFAIAHALIDAGADITTRVSGEVPLNYFAEKALKIAEKILEVGQTIELVTKYEEIKKLLDHMQKAGAKPNPVFKSLLQKINKLIRTGLTPREKQILDEDLIAALGKGEYQQAKQLIEAGANLSVKIGKWSMFYLQALDAMQQADEIAKGLKIKDPEFLPNTLDFLSYMEGEGVKDALSKDAEGKNDYEQAQKFLKKISENPSKEVQDIFWRYFPNFGAAAPKASGAQQPLVPVAQGSYELNVGLIKAYQAVDIDAAIRLLNEGADARTLYPATNGRPLYEVVAEDIRNLIEEAQKNIAGSAGRLGALSFLGEKCKLMGEIAQRLNLGPESLSDCDLADYLILKEPSITHHFKKRLMSPKTRMEQKQRELDAGLVAAIEAGDFHEAKTEYIDKGANVGAKRKGKEPIFVRLAHAAYEEGKLIEQRGLPWLKEKHGLEGAEYLAEMLDLLIYMELKDVNQAISKEDYATAHNHLKELFKNPSAEVQAILAPYAPYLATLESGNPLSASELESMLIKKESK